MVSDENIIFSENMFFGENMVLGEYIVLCANTSLQMLERAPSLFWARLYFLLVILDTFPTLKMHVTSLEETAFPAASSVLC